MFKGEWEPSKLTLNVSQSKNVALGVYVIQVCVWGGALVCIHVYVCACVIYTVHTLGFKEQGIGPHLFFQTAVDGF